MRVGSAWHDACILDISSRGLMVQAATPPEKGSYLELRRGARIIIGRVVWSSNHRFGLSTQDTLETEAIIANPDGDLESADPGDGTAPAIDRRAVAREQQRAFDRSRQVSRAFEFCCVALLGISGCVIAFSAVGEFFGAPLAVVTERLAAK